MNSPTKPFNLLNFDLINKYNLDDEFSDSESPKSSIPQINLLKKSSPKINIYPTKRNENDTFSENNDQKEGKDEEENMMAMSLNEKKSSIFVKNPISLIQPKNMDTIKVFVFL